MERLVVSYELRCERGESAREKAEAIALEQTVELPEACVSAAIRERVVGRLEKLAEGEAGRWRASISYDPALIGGEVGQLLNLLFGNVSMKAGIRVAGVVWPEALLAQFGGPRFGIDGVRQLCGVRGRPLLCIAVKPLGLGPRDLAEICRRFALAGVDLVKDDHSLADQAAAPFRERVARCQEAVEAANRERGGRTLYLPHLSGSPRAVAGRARAARELGCRGVMVCPLLAGWETVRRLTETSGLAVLGHPSLSGGFFAEDHGISPEVLLGTIFRLIGCDGVIYPNAGGRFVFTEQVCAAINRRLREPLGALRRSFPVPAGGIDVARVPEWVGRYGSDTIFLIGSSLYATDDPFRTAAEAIEKLAQSG